MNFIFDIGNVLIDFKPEQFLREILNDPQSEQKINEIIFKSEEWVKLDEGLITPQQACDNFCRRKPEYKELIIKVMDKIPEMLTPMDETAGLLPKIKNLGHKLYYLSNYHKGLSRYIREKYSFFDLFDGGVFSCDIHMIKPSPDIYRYFLNKYNLEPQDCVFFDDTAQNIKSAQKEGIKSVLFTGVGVLNDYLKELDQK